METMTTTMNDILIDKKIKVVPIIRRKNLQMFPKGHDGEFMYTGCQQSYCLPIDAKRRQLISILSKEEQEFFEKALYMNPGDLSIYKKKENFWAMFRVNIDKEGLILNLLDPMDNLRWRVLKVVPQVAPSWDQRFDSGEYVFALVDEDYQVQDDAKKADRIKQAYKFFGSIEGSAERMRNFLRVYGRTPAYNAKVDFLKGEINKIIEGDLNGFLAIVEDKDYETKLFIDKCLEVGALSKAGKTKYALPGGDIIGSTLGETVEFLQNKKNSDIFATLKAKLEAAGVK